MYRYIIHLTVIFLSFLSLSGCGAHTSEADRTLVGEAYSAGLDSLSESGRGRLGKAVALLSETDDVWGAMARYVAGEMAMRQMNFPAAVSNYLFADKIAVAVGRDDIAFRARYAMIELNDRIHNSKGKAEFGRRAYELLDRVELSDSVRMEYYQDIIYTTRKVDKAFAVKVADEYLRRAESLGDSLEVNTARIHARIAGREDDPEFSLRNFDLGDTGEAKFERFMAYVRHLPAGVKFSLPDTVATHQSVIHDFITELWKRGDDAKAYSLLSSLLERYEKDDMAQPWMLTFGYLSSPYAYAYETPSCEGLLSTFQPDVDDVVRRFDYEEIRLKGQMAAYNRNMSLCLVLLLIVVVCFGIFYIRQRAIRSRLQAQELMDSVKELDASFRRSQRELFRNVSKLCDVYYKSNVDGNDRIAKDALKSIEEFVKTPGVFAELENNLNAVSDGLMERFRAAMPELREDEYRLFLCNALGFSVPAMMMLLGEKREVIYNRRLRLRAKITEAAPEEAAFFVEKLV